MHCFTASLLNFEKFLYYEAMRKIFIAGLIVFAGLIAFLFFQPVFAADFGGVGGRPASPDPLIPESKEWFIYTLRPGESKKDAIIVQNSGNEPVEVLLYPADSTPSTDGGFALEQFVESRDFVGAWISLKETEIHLEPNESKIIPFTITVPNDPKLDVGEHTGGILVQKMVQESPQEGGMQLFMRAGVRVYVTIPGEIIKKLEIEKFEVSLNKEKKTYIASIVVKNSGNVSQNFIVHTKIENEYPLFNRIFPQFPMENERNLQVLRNSSFTSNFEFKKPFFGKLKASGSVEYENGAKILTASPIILSVPLDRNILILSILIAVFLVSVIFLFIAKKKYAAKKKSKKKRR